MNLFCSLNFWRTVACVLFISTNCDHAAKWNQTFMHGWNILLYLVLSSAPLSWFFFCQAVSCERDKQGRQISILKKYPCQSRCDLKQWNVEFSSVLCLLAICRPPSPSWIVFPSRSLLRKKPQRLNMAGSFRSFTRVAFWVHQNKELLFTYS